MTEPTFVAAALFLFIAFNYRVCFGDYFGAVRTWIFSLASMDGKCLHLGRVGRTLAEFALCSDTSCTDTGH